MDGVEVVIVAGDTCEGALRAFEHLRRIVPMHIPIVMVMGNHEYYRRFVPTNWRWRDLRRPRSISICRENDHASCSAASASSAPRCGPTTRSSVRPTRPR